VPITGRASFWQDFADGADGRYVYSTIRWTGNVYEKNWTSGNYMGCVVYPGPNGLATSIRWETMRDAVEDYDYLTLLRNAKAGQSNSEAAALLNDSRLGARVDTAEKLLQIRDRIAGWIDGR
jgi:hypothetical protein